MERSVLKEWFLKHQHSTISLKFSIPPSPHYKAILNSWERKQGNALTNTDNRNQFELLT